MSSPTQFRYQKQNVINKLRALLHGPVVDDSNVEYPDPRAPKITLDDVQRAGANRPPAPWERPSW